MAPPAAQAFLPWLSPAAASGLPRPAAAPAGAQGPGRAAGPGPREGAGGTLPGACRAALLLGGARLLARPRGRAARSVRLGAVARDAAAAVESFKLPFDVTSEVGVCAPFGSPGEYVWDPFGETRDMDEEKFRWYRQAEIKHGRVSMMAITGILNQHYWRFEGLQLEKYEGGLGVGRLDLRDLPDGFQAVTGGAGPYLGILILLVGIIELSASDEGREPGNFGDPAYILYKQEDLYDTDWRNFELNHGRLAMFGIVGALAAEYTTGLDSFGQWQAAFGR